MAIKTSNQITFTEQKKILEIKEWYLATTKDSGVTRDPEEGWTLEVQIIDEEKKYLWNYEEVVYSIGSPEVSDPVIIGFYGKGSDGNGISEIKNYYYVTTTPELPDNPDWSPTVLLLSPDNKYLWNYEKFIYTDGSEKDTDAAIIGVYGDSGADAVDFQIYSVDGFEFSDVITSIELKTIAFQAGSPLKDVNISYKWKWWNAESVLDDKYEEIENATSSTLLVNVNDIYAFTSIKCEMLYNDMVYEDYVSLTSKTIVYTAIAKFFNGNNIITANDDYLIVYVELYKDNIPEELLHNNNVYKSDSNSVQDNIITSDINGKYTDGDMMYFVCKNIYDGVVEYDVVPGQYNSSQWQVVSNNYIYKNSLFAHTTSSVVFIPKEKISKSLNISFTIYDGDSTIARTDAMVLDLNDPTINKEAPTDPQNGQLWLDTSVSPNILKMWNGTEWVNSGYQNGNVVYTSQPKDGYSEGDLWILSTEDGEIFKDFGEGAMLKANTTSSTFNISHWIDVDEEATEQKKNIRQYFLFNADTGLRIGQSGDKFYVNISSTEMGFYDASSGVAQKVVSISNQSATIKDLTVEDRATFNCEVHFGNFILKTESNGSLSLALAT